MTVIWRSGFRARRKAAVAPAMPQPMIKTSVFIESVFSSDLEHPLNRTQSASANVFVDEDLKLLFPQRLECIFERDLIHVRTTHTAQPQHLFLRIRCRDIVAHGTLSQQQIPR